MEEGWERTPQLELGPEELERLVAPAFPGSQIEETTLLATGLANTNVKFRLAGESGAYVLRVHTREPEAALRELELMRYLAAHPASGVPVAPLVYSSTGGEEGALAYSIWGFVEGTLLQQLFKELKPSELVDIAAECGRVLAAIAAHRFDKCGQFGSKLAVVHEYGRPSEFVPSMVYQGLYAGRAGERLGEALRDELWRVVERASPLLESIDGRYTLVHGDYKRSNILMQRSGAGWKVGAVLDWEFAFAGPPIVDVGLFLRAGEALPHGFREAFTSAHAAAGGELPADWLPISRLVDLVSQVIFLSGPRDRPNVFAESVAVIQETIRTLA
jgi:aminoglycoside phosphotransferase (APT) family kinase protein